MRPENRTRRPAVLRKVPIVAKPFKVQSTRQLPPDAVIIDHEGKPHVRIKDRGRAVLCPLTKDGKQYLRRSKRWYFDLRDEAGVVRRVKGFPDLKATEQLAADIARKASRKRSGYSDPAEEHALRPLADHLADYAAHLEVKENTADHMALTSGRITALFKGCGFVFLGDVDVGKASEWLLARRRDGRPTEVPAGDSFTPKEVASILGLSGAAVRAAV